MRRFSNKVFLTEITSSALKYSTSVILLVTLLLLSFESATSFAQTDPFEKKKPHTANPFAHVSPSDTDNQENESETPSAAPASANPFNDPPPDGSELKENTETPSAAPASANPFDDSPPATSDGVLSAETLLSDIDSSDARNEPATESPEFASPEPSEDLSARGPIASSEPESIDWMGMLTDNLIYVGLAALTLCLLIGWVFSRRAKKPDVQPRIKTGGSFKKSNRFQEAKKGEEASELETITSENASSVVGSEGIDLGDSSDMFDFDEAADSGLQESGSPPISDAATALTGDASSIDDDDDFLDLMMDDSEETGAAKLTGVADELDDASLKESGVEAVKSVPGDALDDDDDDFLDLMMDDSEETDAAKLTGVADELDDASLKDSDVEVVKSVSSDTLDDDDEFFDMMLEDDDDSPKAVEEVAPLAQSTESKEIDTPIESQDLLAMDDDSDEFTFDFEDDASAETASVGLVEEDLTQKAEEIIASDADDLSSLSDELNEDVLADLAADGDIEDVEQDEDQSLVAGGVAAAAGALAGVGAMFGAQKSADSDQPKDDAASEELRQQLAQSLQKEQQSAAKINAQEAELQTLNAKLQSAAASSGDNEKLQQQADELKGKLEVAEKNAAEFETKLSAAEKNAAEFEAKLGAAEENAAEFETKLSAAESSIDALEKEKQEIETQLEKQSDDSEEIKQLETKLSELKSQAEETSTAKEQLQSEVEELRKEVSSLKAVNEEEAADSEMLKQLKNKYDEELTLRKETETMLVEAEQQRTDVAMALRDLRKQVKEQGDSGGSPEEFDTLKSQLADIKSANENLEQQLDDLRGKLEQEHSVAKELTSKLTLSQEKVSAATIVEDQWKQKLETLESEMETKTKETSRLTADLQTAKESLGEFEETVAELKAKEDDHKAIVAKHEASLLESHSNLEAAIAEKSQVEVTLGDLKEKAGALSYGQLEEALASVAKLSEERSVQELKLEQTRTAGEEAARLNGQLSERVAQLEKQLDSNSETANQLAEARKQLEFEKNQAIIIEKEKNGLQLQVDSLKQKFESLDRQRLSLKENLEARVKEAADGEAMMNKETAKLHQKIAALEQSLSNPDGTGDIRLQLTEGKENLRYAHEQNSVLAERVAGLEQQLTSRHADAEKLDSVQQQLVSQAELMVGAKEENATLKERVGQLNEQIKMARDRSVKLEQTVEELNQERDRLSQVALNNAANQQRIKLLEDQIAEGKDVSLQLNETNNKLAKASGERVALNQQVGLLQRDLEAAEKSNQALRQKLGSGTSPGGSGSIDSEKLERILGQLQTQNLQIGRLADENKNLAAKLASQKTTSSRKSSLSKTTKRTEKVTDKGLDDLTEIVGIGPLYKKKLYGAGVKTYRQVAAWTKEDIEKYSKKLGFKSGKRIQQEKWVSQAKKLS